MVPIFHSRAPPCSSPCDSRDVFVSWGCSHNWPWTGGLEQKQLLPVAGEAVEAQVQVLQIWCRPGLASWFAGGRLSWNLAWLTASSRSLLIKRTNPVRGRSTLMTQPLPGPQLFTHHKGLGFNTHALGGRSLQSVAPGMSLHASPLTRQGRSLVWQAWVGPSSAIRALQVIRWDEMQTQKTRTQDFSVREVKKKKKAG